MSIGMARMLRIEPVRMNRYLVLVLMLGVALSACRGSDAREPRSPENFEVISEGSASGVTSTLGGESINSMTSTAADTTTEFTILQEPALTDTTGTTLADQLPTTTAVTPTGGVSPAPVPVARPTIEISRSAPPATSTQPPRATAPQPVPRPDPPTTTTPPATQPAPEPPPSDTATPPSDEESEEAPADDEESEEEAPPPPTNT